MDIDMNAILDHAKSLCVLQRTADRDAWSVDKVPGNFPVPIHPQASATDMANIARTLKNAYISGVRFGVQNAENFRLG